MNSDILKIHSIIKEEVQKVFLTEFLSMTASKAAFINGKKYLNQPNTYIHFSQINKLGINPNKGHHDPHGIYFYPLKWVMNEENWTAFQYAVNMPYYFICKVDTSRFLNLGTIDQKKVESLFKSAGYGDLFYRIDFTDFQGKTAAKRFWQVLDMLNVNPANRKNIGHSKFPQITWNQFFGKLPYDGLYDTKGIIASEEWSQIVVFNPSVITLLESGENKTVRQEYTKYFQEIGKTVGYEVIEEKYIKNGKEYYVHAKKDNKYIKIFFSLDYNYFVIFTMKDGHLEKYKSDMNLFSNLPISSVVYHINKSLEEADSGIDVDEQKYYQFINTTNQIYDKVFERQISGKEGELWYRVDEYPFWSWISLKNNVYEFYYGRLDESKFEFKAKFKTLDELKKKFESAFQKYLKDYPEEYKAVWMHTYLKKDFFSPDKYIDFDAEFERIAQNSEKKKEEV